MFAGSFKQMPFSEVVRLLSSSNQTGVLNVKEAGTDIVIGQLYLQMGQLIDAVQGSHSGLDAVQELCRWIDADFAFDASAESARQSLVAYPTEKLIDKIKLRTDELKAIKDSMPQPNDRPLYQPGVDASGLNVHPEELALLLQCSGEKSVAEIAATTGESTDQVSATLARFRHAGIITIENSQEAPGNPVVSGNTASPEDISGKPVRYWRGHKVE